MKKFSKFNTLFKEVFVVAIFICTVGISIAWGMHPGSTDIMLQGFHWRCKNNGQHGEWYNLLASKAQDIRETGVSMVWFPPPSKTPRYDLDEYGDWASACGYMPMDYYDLGEYQQWVQDDWPPNDMDGKWYQHAGTETLYGSRAELEGAIKVFHDQGIKVIADIVLGHRGPRQKNNCGEFLSWGDNNGQVESGMMIWGRFPECDPPEIIYDDGGSGGGDDGENGEGYKDIAHQNSNVRNQFKDLMGWLKHNIGFDGWRYDYVKSFAADHIGEYNDNTDPYWSVGEFWDEDNVDQIINWINASHPDNAKKSTAFDFPTKKILTNNFGNQNYNVLAVLPGLMGRWPEKAVTFLDNHDTHPPCPNPKQFPDNRLLEGYAYILTHPGVPCIYWQHFYDKSSTIHDKIKELAQIRKEQGINNTSSVKILRAEQNLYAAEIDGKTAVKIGTTSWEPANSGLSGYSIRANFGDYKIWVK